MFALFIGIVSAVIGGILGAAGARLWRRGRQYRENVLQLKDYRAAILSADVNIHGPQALTDILARYPSSRYVVPWLCLENGSRYPAREFLLSSAVNVPQERLVVHGIFGSGKTALCLDLLREVAARSATSRLIRLKKAIVPIYVALGTTRVTLDSGFRESIDQLLIDYRLGSFGGLSGLYARCRPILILDGFDQLLPTASPYQRAAALADINNAVELAAASAGSSPWMLLTMRSDLIDVPDSPLVNALNGQVSSEAGGTIVPAPAFTQTTLGGLDDQQLVNYMIRHVGLSEEDARLAIQKLRSNVHASEWIRHPLLLNIFLTVGRDQLTGAGPLNVARLYRSYAEYWFMNDARLIRFGSSARRNEFVEDLAISLLETEAESLPIEDIYGGDKKGKWSFLKDILLDRDQLYGDKSNESFLLINRDDTVMFSHRSFMEYFAARRALQLFRKQGEIPASLSPRIYSNLIISFLRDSVSERDYEWVYALAEHKDTYHRYLGYALLPMVVGSDPRESRERLRELFVAESDIDAKRHILFGIGSLDLDPCDAATAAFLRERRIDWLASALQYFRTRERQRLHCIHRLRSFELGNRAFWQNRGLYIFDLGEVGEAEDVQLIRPYSDEFVEHNPVIVEIANDAIRRIKQRSLAENWSSPTGDRLPHL